jgi:hypothetical protein
MDRKEILAKIAAVFAGPVVTCESTDLSGREIELDLAEFIQLVAIIDPPVLFLNLTETDPALYLSNMLTKNVDGKEDDEIVVQRFVSEHKDVVERFRTIAREAIAIEIFFIKEGTCFIYHHTPDEVLELESAIDVYSGELNAIAEAEEERRSREEEKLMTRLKNELMKDGTFKTLRGLRKRCVYIQEKYGSEVPRSVYLERPDKGSDMMDANIVRLARRVSDTLNAST